ncbi:hypothetical protein F5Y13DRAFT_189378 [Hypoxylon sp. FL1857]|nr:hypothetical protein F5Y13DRAFT_189378 [Hypoxylon sp. FL1857]
MADEDYRGASEEELKHYWRLNSTPRNQFDDLILEEMSRTWDADPKRRGSDKNLYIHRGIQGGYLYNQAFEEVKAQWVEQGIWRESWGLNGKGPAATDRWKHEERLQCVFDEAVNKPGYEARYRPKWKAEVIHQHEASRPIHQFIYQMGNERERLAAGKEGEDAGDISSDAYHIVRMRWADRHIWDEGWSVLPGMTWQHEKPYVCSDSEGDEDYIETSLPPRVKKLVAEREKTAKLGLSDDNKPIIHPLVKRARITDTFEDSPMEDE